MTQTTQIMTTKEIAAYFKVSPALILKLCKTGELPYAKVGGEIRFNKNEVEKAVFGK